MTFILDILHWLWNLLESSVEAVEVWFLTRQWELAPGGLPACLVAAVVLFVVLGQRSKPAVAVAEPYRQEFHAAIAAKDYDRAELFLRKLNDLQVADNSSRFQFAILAGSTGRFVEAFEQISALAPADRIGYPPAHLWMAERELRRQAAWTAEQRGSFIHHLTAAKTDSTLKPRAAELLGFLHLSGGDFPAAVEELRTIGDPTLNARIALAIACHLAGRRDESQTAWSGVVSACERQLTVAPDNNDLRLLLAIAHSYLQQQDRALQVLREGLQRTSGAEDHRLKDALGLAIAQRLGGTIPPGHHSEGDREKLLQELLDLAPSSTAVALRLLRWPSGDSNESQRIQNELRRRAEADGPGGASLLALLGTTAAQAGQIAVARQHLEQANRRTPNNPMVLNNLAWALANSQPPELGRALELAQDAARLRPDHPEIRETRGQILFSLGKWQAAIDDLEWSLPKVPPPSRPAIHRTLSKAYGQLGDAPRAEKHRALATQPAEGAPTKK